MPCKVLTWIMVLLMVPAGFAADEVESFDESKETIEFLIDWNTHQGVPGGDLPQDVFDTRERISEYPARYATILDSLLTVPSDPRELLEPHDPDRGVASKLDRLWVAVHLCRHLGPEHGAQVLREFEAVLRTRIEDRYWQAVMAHRRGADQEDVGRLAAPRSILELHKAVVGALAEMGDRSLVPSIVRGLSGDRAGGHDAERRYLLRAVRAGDAEARRWLEYLLEEHPNSFHDYTSRSRKWETKAREALAAGEAVGRSEGESSSAEDDADEGEAGAAP